MTHLYFISNKNTVIFVSPNKHQVISFACIFCYNHCQMINYFNLIIFCLLAVTNIYWWRQQHLNLTVKFLWFAVEVRTFQRSKYNLENFRLSATMAGRRKSVSKKGKSQRTSQQRNARDHVNISPENVQPTSSSDFEATGHQPVNINLFQHITLVVQSNHPPPADNDPISVCSCPVSVPGQLKSHYQHALRQGRSREKIHWHSTFCVRKFLHISVWKILF